MKTLLSWSSGKDSAWSLYRLQNDPRYDVVGLLTTTNELSQRAAMHGVREDIVVAQAEAARLPLHIVPLPWPCPNGAYEELMANFIEEQKKAGIEAMAFGDLFLEDIRDYRIERLKGTGIEPVFPVWGCDTRELALEMIDGGLKTIVAVTDLNKLTSDHSGRDFDRAFLEDLPEGIDWCGENGEFHTCVIDGPMFARPLEVERGHLEVRDGFAFTDLKLSSSLEMA